MMRRLLASLVLATISVPALAQVLADKDAKDLLTVTDYLNGECRSGIGDDQKTLKACDMRDVMFAYVKKNGWCYGAPGTPTSKWKWHRCKAPGKK